MGTRRERIFIRQKTKGDKWYKATADIGRIKGEFQLEFQATRGFSYSGDVAIDDVSFEECALPVAGRRCYSFELTCGL